MRSATAKHGATVHLPRRAQVHEVGDRRHDIDRVNVGAVDAALPLPRRLDKEGDGGHLGDIRSTDCTAVTCADIEADSVVRRHDYERTSQEPHALEAIEQLVDLAVDEPNLEQMALLALLSQEEVVETERA